MARQRYVTNAITSPLLPLYLAGTNHPLHAFAVDRPGLLSPYPPSDAKCHLRNLLLLLLPVVCVVFIQLFLMGIAPRQAHTLRQGKQMNGGVVQVAMACCDSASKAKYIFYVLV